MQDESLFADRQADQDSYDEDPSWTPEETDQVYETLKEDDDSIKTNANPRYDVHVIYFIDWLSHTQSKPDMQKRTFFLL